MNKSLRLVLAASMLFTIAPVASFAAMGGTNPHPQTVDSGSTSSATVAAILTILGL